MRKIGFLFIFFFLFVACTKKRFPTVPYVEFESADKKVVKQGETLELVYYFRDAEGDISNYFNIVKNIINVNRQTSPLSTYLLYPPDNLPLVSNAEGKIKLNLEYYSHIGSPLTIQNDTVLFGLFITDLANNVSDTAYSDTIVILR